jgi:hypothetical protein
VGKKSRGGAWKKEGQEMSRKESYRRGMEKGRAGKYWEEGRTSWHGDKKGGK